MKKQAIVGIAMVLGLIAGGAAYAAECGSCGDKATCNETDSVKNFLKETSDWRNELKAKNLELQHEYSYNSIDANRTAELEKTIKEDKTKIASAAKKLGVQVCCAL